MEKTQAVLGEEVEWDLSDIYAGPDDPALERAMAESSRAALAFHDRYHGKVASLDAPALAAAIEECERIESTVQRATTFAELRFSMNTADPARGALLQQLQEQAASLETLLLFFQLEWNAIADDRAERLLADPSLKRYRHFMAALRRYRPHILSEPEEKILTEKTVSGPAAWSRLHMELLAGLRVPFDGKEISFEDAFAKLQDPSRDVRRAAAEGITEGLKPGLRTRAFAFNSILLDKSVDDRLRKYPSWISSRNVANEVTDEAVQALVDTVVSRHDVPQRYYKIKARLLGLDRLAHYDRTAPFSRETRVIPWEDARRTVMDAYASFSKEAGDTVAAFFQRNWIDAAMRPDKASGAFCASVPEVHPYVLMSYTGDRRSVLTLAHELGHGLHGVLAQPLGLYNSSTPLTLAETASVFGEVLTFKRLVEAERDPRRRLDLLAGRIEDAIATIWRQIAMNRFEDRVHTSRRTKGELSPDAFAEIWMTTQRELFGDSVDATGYDVWWSYIPHFVAAPGYVYAYAYGYLFALAIYRRYEREGDTMVAPYLELLRQGGSQAPEDLARIVGLDLSNPGIWASGIDALDELLGEAEELAKKAL
ncbi:MAG TPA: M3 family oligoendopeptidase [Candidatus Limnocylindrales bacterium]|nr:M3 family oligoendopeptidase [Candidatus Limnocylindrales bacterium]